MKTQKHEKFCSRNYFVPLCTYLFFGCLFVINTSINPPFCSFYFVPFILHAWKIWKYINTSITIIQQRKNLFSSSRNLAGPCFFTLRKLQCGYFPQIIHWFEYSNLILDLLAAIKSSGWRTFVPWTFHPSETWNLLALGVNIAVAPFP